ncbi:hypothetical protein BTO06_04035 [Tenacibaculum sp. SZ-18]|uniref:hypothetical protein n=1 Tax=Tenacibaculum sp. SZ-18 TaxID=754423 RepID=UPI000C2D60C5|nr:hypothetical protein [Tenacibaculum sp. SZ-18]AUC14362.1 hypothetical protein BTO06_04035 [Tenacibaculum sp. SZ-18]
MELQGSLIERVIKNDESISLEGLRDVYFKNLESTPVDIGLLKLLGYEDTSFASNVTLDQKNLQISFDTTKGNKKKLYLRAIKVTGCICREE